MNDKLLSTLMQKYLYQDLYNLEESHWWHKTKRNLVGLLIKHYYHGGKSKILDVGCGTGKNIEAFSEFGECYGMDYSDDAILFCKKRGIKNVIKGNIENIPFQKQSVDIITALDVLEHVDDRKALKEIHRVLKKDGLLIVAVPAFPKLWSRWDEILHHKRRYTKRSLEKTLQVNNFKILKISYMYSFMFLPVVIIRFIKNIFFKNHYPSDFKLSNKAINFLLGYICAFESFFIINTSVSFGTSLVTVARKT